MKEKKYEEVGSNYRFFLGWRHASLAGIFIILYGIASLTIEVYKQTAMLACFVPALCSPIGLIFWLVDRRTRNLYHAAITAGKKLEGFEGGVYSELSKIVQPPKSKSWGKITQSSALNILFLGTSLLLIITSTIIFITAILKLILKL